MALATLLATLAQTVTSPDSAATFMVTWPRKVHGDVASRVSLIVSRDLSREPRLSIGSSFTNAGQIFSVPVASGKNSVTFPAPGQKSFPFDSLLDFPAGPALLQAVLTPYVRYDNRSDGHTLWLPDFRAFEYSEDYDSYGWANVSHPFGGAKGLSAEGVLYSKPEKIALPLPQSSNLEIMLSETVPAFPPPPPETDLQKRVSIQSQRLSQFWGQPINVSAWVTLPADFHARPNARYPLIINHGHYSYQRLRGWADSPPATVVPPRPKTGNPDDCYFCSSGGG